MPSAARLPIVTSRSLLLPPIRVPLRALQWLYRPQCVVRPPQCLGQGRSLHLFKTSRATTVLGMHKVLTFSPYQLAKPSVSEHKVNLVEGESQRPTMLAENITLQELYDRHIKPGDMLYLVHALKKSKTEYLEKLKDENVAGNNRNYAIMKAHTSFAHIAKGKKSDHFHGLKVIPFSLSSPMAYFKLVLDRMYQFIEQGSPIEVRMRFKGAKLTKEERMQPGDAEVWPWMHNHFPHLRPDFIIKAMPEGTNYMIEPWSNGRQVQFVMSRKVKGMPQVNLMQRLAKVKTSVQQSIKRGKQSQLPGVMRRQLQEAGHSEYTLESGLPRQVAARKYGGDGRDGSKWEYTGESADDALPTSRFLAPTRKSLRKAGAGKRNRWDGRGRVG